MQVVHPICCGIDVHQAQLTVYLRRVTDEGQVTRRCGSLRQPTPLLLALLDWLSAQQCPVVAMESPECIGAQSTTSSPEPVEVLLGNAHEMRRRPGKKTDKADARWIAELLAHGLIRPSFIPPPAIQALRDLTRPRVALVHSRSHAKNRVTKILEDTNIKLSSIVADLFGASGRCMLAALIAGEREPQALAALARGRLRRETPTARGRSDWPVHPPSCTTHSGGARPH